MPQVGTLLGLALALLFHPWTWKVAVPTYGLYVLGAVIVIVLNKVWFSLYPCVHVNTIRNACHGQITFA